ncbi:MAG: 50S ribosome-binding GTPase, partial [Candidatus Sumerlaeota bacterium]|nr:50S ribosome-binding GTPase [Candidatus Sumerlaeota bacterium]
QIVIADIPGLIEGASRGAGLGDRFLRHIERTRLLVHLVPIELDSQDFETLFSKYKLLMTELCSYSETLVEKPQIVVLNKIDLAPDKTVRSLVRRFKKEGISILPVSAEKNIGLKLLLARILKTLDEMKKN